jgi:hypothetical protein
MEDKLATGSPDAAKEWNYTTDVFTAKVIEVDATNNKLLLNFTSPEKMPFVNQEKWVSVSCSPTEMYVANNGNFTNLYYPFFQYVKTGLSFSSYCKSDVCAEAGDLCRLYY